MKRIICIIVTAVMTLSLMGCQAKEELERTTCPYCKNEVDSNTKFCPECGISMSGANETIAPVQMAPLDSVQYMEEKEEIQEYLNVFDQNNVQNEATFIEHNGWIYGQAWDDDGNSQFIKVRTDGSDWTVLDTGLAHNIYIIDNYVYYMLNNGDDSGIYKVKTSGEDRCLISHAYGVMQIRERQIYYVDYDYKYTTDSNGNMISVLPLYCHLFRCELDGSNLTKIISKPTFHFYVFEDGILYQDDNDGSSLHICETDGTNDYKVNDDVSYWPLYDGKYIYYVKETREKRNIWRIKPDGTDDQLVADYMVSEGMMLTDSYIYFIYGDDSDRIYRIGKDGSNLTLITQDTNVRWIQLFDNYLKYTKRTEDNEYIEANYFCDYDGSGKWDFLDIAY